MLKALFKLKLYLGSSTQKLAPVARRSATVMSGQPGQGSLNVFGSALGFFSNRPITGYKRNGFCEVPPRNSLTAARVAAEVTDEFLDFSDRNGNDLRMGGLTAGCKWCLCASRWKEAFDARKSDDDPLVPRVFLNATNQKALGHVTLEQLKMFEKKE